MNDEHFGEELGVALHNVHVEPHLAVLAVGSPFADPRHLTHLGAGKIHHLDVAFQAFRLQVGLIKHKGMVLKIVHDVLVSNILGDSCEGCKLELACLLQIDRAPVARLAGVQVKGAHVGIVVLAVAWDFGGLHARLVPLANLVDLVPLAEGEHIAELLGHVGDLPVEPDAKAHKPHIPKLARPDDAGPREVVRQLPQKRVPRVLMG
mmetsp:Transcript_24607/g.47840  ORF Transcript_24607/g.47840 Transcript_24607/m.47840 type:complete len:206 (+) Transcript_24607:230-847(+)